MVFRFSTFSGGENWGFAPFGLRLMKLRILDQDKRPESNFLLNKAIDFAEKAYNILSDSSETTAEKIYSLNLSLYFLAKSDNKEIDRMKEYARKLISYAYDHKDKWQFRYDDSVAFHYCKLAVVHAGTKKDLEQYIKDANQYLIKAKKVAPEDEVVQETDRVFESIKANRAKIVAGWSGSQS